MPKKVIPTKQPETGSSPTLDEKLASSASGKSANPGTRISIDTLAQGRKITSPEKVLRLRKAVAIKDKANSVDKTLQRIARQEKSLNARKERAVALKKTVSAVRSGQGVVQSDLLETKSEVLQSVIDEKPVIFKPTAKQVLFLSANEREVLYGGAAGSGKSYAILADPVRYFNNGNFRGILFRRTNDELRELIWKSREMYGALYKNAKWSEQKSTWTFPSGATMWVTYLDRDDDLQRYTGQSFSWIGFDELTHWPTPVPWNYMRSRLRTTDTSLPLFMRATCNPGNVGGKWVKAMFVDPATPGEAFWATDIEKGTTLVYPKGHPREGEPLFKRRFIPANLRDNPYLMQTDDYMANLMSLPEIQRRQLLEGDWDVAEGAMFDEFKRHIHVIDPFPVPAHWPRFRAADWGYKSPACCLWFAVGPDGELYVYRELYVTNHTSVEFANKVLEMEEGENVRYGILDVSAWNQRGDTGPSIAEQMIQYGCRWRPSDRSKNSRANGWMELHRRLRVDPETEEPSIFFFSNCINTIRTVPMVPIDKNNPDDIDTDSEDHALDALRYGIMSRPHMAARPSSSFAGGSYYIPADTTFGY